MLFRSCLSVPVSTDGSAASSVAVTCTCCSGILRWTTRNPRNRNMVSCGARGPEYAGGAAQRGGSAGGRFSSRLCADHGEGHWDGRDSVSGVRAWEELWSVGSLLSPQETVSPLTFLSLRSTTLSPQIGFPRAGNKCLNIQIFLLQFIASLLSLILRGAF